MTLSAGWYQPWQPSWTSFALYCAVRFHVERIERMAARHIEAVVLQAAEAQVRAALGQADEGDRLALRVEHHHAVEVFWLALQGEHLAAANIGWLVVKRTSAAPAAPEIVVPVDPEAIECALIGGIDQFRLVGRLAVV